MTINDKLLSHLVEESDFLPLISIDDSEDDKVLKFSETMPVLALRNTVVFPGVIIPITVGRERSLQAVKAAIKEEDGFIAVLAQRDMTTEDPDPNELQNIGTIAQIVKTLKLPDGNMAVIIQGKRRFTATTFVQKDPYIKTAFALHPEKDIERNDEFDALISSLKDHAAQIIKLSPNIPSEAELVLKNINSPAYLINYIASNLNIDLNEKQEILEISDIRKRAEVTLDHLNKEIKMLELKDKIQSKVKGDIEKQQRDYFLNQQLKTIQEELGGNPIDKEVKDLEEKSKDKEWPQAVAETFQKELNKLRRINPAAAEYSVLINYLELLLELPWNETTDDNFDLKHAKKILNEDHYGLDKIKDRILEYLAVLKLKGDLKSPILCFVGPPGVGKTSLGKSIARALDRKYVRMAIGGLHDEAEIRGHRKTYIGAMPGRIIQSLKKVKSSNPVFILDEIDKVGKDFRGDPSSALLEVLDPEQNNAFYDNYLELEYDLSKVLFVATANDINTIQPALRDRMEIIQLTGYSLEEKIEIAKKHLVPKQLEAHGLKSKHAAISKKAMSKIIDEYTRESGVRSLDRQIAAVMRYVAKHVATEEKYDKNIDDKHINEILGRVKFDKDKYSTGNPPGVAVGLAWTRTGGDILFIESNLSKGKGKLTLTGNLGNVMKESVTTALSYIKANHARIGINPEMLEQNDIHVHVPEGAIPKDGPSAGITMLTALTSVFSKRKVRSYVAMTGEITLRGKVLPVGGIKEKILAAKRAGIKEIILCEKNRKDIEDIVPAYIKGLKFHFVAEMMDVLEIAIGPMKELKVKKKAS